MHAPPRSHYDEDSHHIMRLIDDLHHDDELHDGDTMIMFIDMMMMLN